MKIKTLLIILVLSVLYSQTYSQFSLITSEQQFIEAASDSALFIIRQDYVLKNTNTGVEYGLNGKEYYGRVYGLAVYADGKLWSENKLKRPWFFDINFSKYINSDTLKPALSKSAIKPINGSLFKEISLLPISESSYDSILNKIGLAQLNFQNSQNGINIKSEIKDNNGWLLIAYTDDLIKDNENCKIKIAIYKPKLKFSDNSLEAKIDAPNISKNILGGIYFTPSFSTGTINLTVAGILSNRLINWYISTIPNQQSTAQTNSINVNNSSNIDYIRIKLVHKDGFILKQLCGITVEGDNNIYCTDETGIAKIPVSDSSKKLIMLNGEKAVCAKKGELKEIICIYPNDKFVPKKTINKCD